MSLLRDNPNLKDEQILSLVNCSLRTVTYAKAKLRKKLPQFKQTISKDNPACIAEAQEINPVDLLMSKCMEMMSRPNPDSRWGGILKDILKTTGRLDIQLKNESEGISYLSKLSSEDLAKISIGKDSPVNRSEPDEEGQSLYR